MFRKSKPGDHPIWSFFVGFFVIGVISIVLTGIFYHFAFSSRGPAIMLKVKQKVMPEEESVILKEAMKHETFETHRHFHNIVEVQKLPSESTPVCFICHSDYPHRKNKKVRSLLNMHTQYFVCETCHIKEKEGAEIAYRWHNPINPDSEGPYFGTDYDAHTGKLIEVEDKLAKVTPYFKVGEKIESAVQAQDAPLAKDYMKIRDQLTPEQRDGVKNKFHVNIKPKGFECQSCHSKEGILDLAELGFSEKRIVDLKQLNIKSLFTKYEDFYLPNLFKDTGENASESSETVQ